MIHDRERIFERIRRFQWAPLSVANSEKIQALNLALNESVQEIARLARNPLKPASPGDGRVHLAYSGGVDSTLLLYKFLLAGFQVTAHTLAGHKTHADLRHAEMVVQGLGGLPWVEHKIHLVGREQTQHTDMYGVLMSVVAPETPRLVGGDCIDEMLGGYYDHRGPNPDAFKHRIGHLIPQHLEVLEKYSTEYGVEVFLPYASAGVVSCCQTFDWEEMADEKDRKKPIYKLAQSCDIPRVILERRKYGLVSALQQTN